MGTCFILAMSTVKSKVPQVVYERALQKELKDKIQNSIDSVCAKLQVLSNIYPEIALGLKTRFACRMILNKGRHTIQHLEHEGMADPADTEVLIHQIEYAMRALGRNLKGGMQPPSKQNVMKSVKWFSNMPRNLQDRLMGHSQTMQEPEGAVLVQEGDTNKGLGLILQGIVKLQHGSETNYLGPGRTFNIYGVLSGDKAADSITAQTSVTYYMFDRKECFAAIQSSSAVDELWVQHGIRKAGNLLATHLPYVLWEAGTFRIHMEAGVLLTFSDQEAATLWPKYEYVLLHGTGTVSGNGKRFHSTSVLPTSLDVDTESESYKKNMAEMRQAFDKYDEDGSGSIDEHELAQVLRHMGYNYSSSEITKLMYDVDTDGSGAIEFDEFLQLSEKMTMIFSKGAKVLQVPRHQIDVEEEDADNVDDHDQDAPMGGKQKKQMEHEMGLGDKLLGDEQL
eukprot:NODE_456_length_1727_cov_219.207390_g362_i1.p1 GENE.NODE_456_length_1727_cov_219.207390_g362_i1~~NODE_456_length_1727_cov_219.207390_g362_i1.p1  ORF type:complete len:527 (+),score=161.96 NODE_456_length_1727_cov_219.207390_g362_i1:229-1581(+)